MATKGRLPAQAGTGSPSSVRAMLSAAASAVAWRSPATLASGQSTWPEVVSRSEIPLTDTSQPRQRSRSATSRCVPQRHVVPAGDGLEDGSQFILGEYGDLRAGHRGAGDAVYRVGRLVLVGEPAPPGGQVVVQREQAGSAARAPLCSLR